MKDQLDNQTRRMEVSVPTPGRYHMASSQTRLLRTRMHIRHRQQRSTTFVLRLELSWGPHKVSSGLHRFGDELASSPSKILWSHDRE
ncbi:hypothetical protein ACVINI_005634 [Rhizobium beringeri]